MKILIRLISIVIVFISCQPVDKGKVEIRLKHMEKNNSHLLIMTVKNNCSTPIFIPKLASIELCLDSMIILNAKGEIINKQFVDDELKYGISFYGPPVNGKVITDICSDNPNVSEEIDLDLPHFNDRKNMIRSIIQSEYENAISNKQFGMITEEDVNYIKSLIFLKYKDSIFLKPGETYRDCITINTLFQKDEVYKVFLHYTPSNKVERFTYHFKFGSDSLVINSNLLDVYNGYSCYNGILKSDTLVIN